MLSTLRINYNRERQAGITQEITEIAGSAESLAVN
jgi:F0F1-type ATP synthase gamma subunit